VDDLARVILSIWQDEQTASAQIEHNRERIIDYSWQSAAERFMQLFEKIINSPDCCGN
jgi:glycosyltransferase involved in cell wall biosynthesis